MTDLHLTCAALDERVAEYLDGTLDASTRAAVERHLGHCERCRALVADLQSITREAGVLPDLAPAHDLWPEIAARIEAPVISLPSAPERRRRVWRAAWLAGVAAGLVLTTAAVTYIVVASRYQQQIAQQPAPAATAPVVAAAPPSPAPDRSAPAPQRTTAAPAARLASNAAKRLPVEQMYDREIEQLQTIVRERRGDLDSNTVAVITKNLKVIDAAIAESRTALAKDPHSHFLNDQLNTALSRKVELLRTVALLPSGT